MQVKGTEAKSRFGYVCAQEKAEPVFIEKDGRIDSVILVERQKAYNETHKAWIDEQNTRFEKNGMWCDDLRVW